MRALMRRHTRRHDGVFQLGPLTVDADKRMVTRGEHRVSLSPREYRLLMALGSRARPGARAAAT
jgi:DNA-binding response OmpR family regulator